MRLPWQPARIELADDAETDHDGPAGAGVLLVEHDLGGADPVRVEIELVAGGEPVPQGPVELPLGTDDGIADIMADQQRAAGEEEILVPYADPDRAPDGAPGRVAAGAQGRGG